MPNILLNGKALSFDTILYIDNATGNDTTGNGSKETPYKTLTKAHQFHSGNTAYILGDGLYESANINNAKYTNSSISYIGNGIRTTFKLTGTLTVNNANTAYTNCSWNFYKLIWDGNNFGSTNFICFSGTINFNNIVFNNIGNDRYGYFCPVYTNTKIVMNNCTKTNNSTNFIRCDTGSVAELSYCYGGFTAGYGSNLTTMNKINNVFTATPILDTEYRILENVVYNIIGVHYGDYSWMSYNIIATFNKNYIKEKTDNIEVTIVDIIQSQTLNMSTFKILLNNIIIYDTPISLSFPKKINVSFNNIETFLDINDLRFSIDGSLSQKFNIYYEGDGLLNPVTRDFKITDWVDKSNVALNPGIGISLTNQNRQGSVFTDISVYKKAEVKKVTVYGDNDKVITGNFTFKPNFIDTYFYKNVITRPFGSKFTSIDYKGLQDLIYMKAPLEFPDNFNLTDGDNSTYIAGDGRTYTFILDKPYTVISNTVLGNGTDGGYYATNTTIKYFDINEQLLYSKTVNAFRNTLVNDTHFIQNVKKVTVYTNNDNGTAALYTININGFSQLGDQFNLFSSTKYINYSNFNYNISKLILEDPISPITKDIVKSKKMYAVEFINNPSKVVVKKASTSSNQTSSKIVRNKIDLTNIPMRKIEVK